MRTSATIAELAQRARPATAERVGLVPTMGALHAGHRALIDAARAECDTVVVSLFVNPAQFDEAADLAAYPARRGPRRRARSRRGSRRPLRAGRRTRSTRPASRPGSTSRSSRAASRARYRPGHFRGVATVCLKLFNIVRPQFAYFGQKDAQQVAVVRRMVRDLDLDLTVRSIPTVRDPDGLASRRETSCLSEAERAAALALPRALATRDPAAARAALDGLDVDYVEVADFDPPVLAAAVRVGSTRLIDNVILDKEER